MTELGQALYELALRLVNALPGHRVTLDLEEMEPRQRAWHQSYRKERDER
jgi:hypothetical protein